MSTLSEKELDLIEKYKEKRSQFKEVKSFLIPPQTKLRAGGWGILESPCPSVHLPVCLSVDTILGLPYINFLTTTKSENVYIY